MKAISVAVAAAAAVFGSAGFAVGSAGIAPWQRSAPAYSCHGYQGAAWCRLRGTAYDAFVTKGRIGIYFGGGAVFSCDKGVRPSDDCYDLR